jgi:hypothetical protein
MQIASRIYATEAAALAALKTASPLFVSTDKESGADRLSPSGMPGDRQRFDIVLTPLTEPVEGTIPGPQMPDGSRMPDMPAPATPTGEFQVDVYWQGKSAPTLSGGRAADAPATAFEPPALPIVATEVPQIVTLFQGRTIMRQMPMPGGGTLFDAVDAYIETHKADNPTLYDAWNYSNGFDRHGAMIGSLGPQFNLTDQILDALFTAAAKVHA